VAEAAPLAKDLFGAERAGSPHRPAPFGSYSRGCVAGAVQLPETGPTWQAMRLSRNRNWGHPKVIDYIKKLSRFAAKQPGWERLYVGDISQSRGVPMTSGHQIGLDVNIWMLPPKRFNLSVRERENIFVYLAPPRQRDLRQPKLDSGAPQDLARSCAGQTGGADFCLSWREGEDVQ